MKNKLSENEFYKKIEILKDAKLRARKAFINGEKVIPKVPSKECPYILDFLAEKLLEEFGWNISTKKRMLEIFDDFGIKIKEGKNE